MTNIKTAKFKIEPHSKEYIEDLTKDELDYELLKGMNDIEKGNVKSSDEVDEILKERLGI